MNETMDFVKENKQDPDYKMLWEYAIKRREETEKELETLAHEHDDALRELHEAQEEIERLTKALSQVQEVAHRMSGENEAFRFCVRCFTGRGENDE